MSTSPRDAVNPVFHEWYIIAVAMAAIGYLVWTLLKDGPSIGNARLKIREIISSAFQGVVVQEARAVFRQVDDRLPYSLSQVDVVDPERSSFDILLAGLSELEEGESGPSREAYHAIVVKALGDVVVHQVEKLLAEAALLAESAVGERESPSGLRVSFSAGTERRLELVGEIMSQTTTRERRFYRARGMADRLTLAAIVAAMAMAVPVFFPQPVAYRCFILGIVAFAVLALSSFVAAFVASDARNWLDEHSERYETGMDMMKDFSARLGRPV